MTDKTQAKSPQKRHFLSRSAIRRARIDGRSTAGRAVKATRSALIESLGGETQVSAQQRMLVGVLARDAVLLEAFDTQLLSTRRRDYAVLLGHRETLASAMTRRLSLLGLDKRAGDPMAALRATLGHAEQPSALEPADEEIDDISDE